MIKRVKTLLLEAGINPVSTIEYEVNGDLHVMTLQEIAEQFARASPDSREIFIEALEKALREGKNGVQTYFEKMGKLLLMMSVDGE